MQIGYSARCAASIDNLSLGSAACIVILDNIWMGYKTDTKYQAFNDANLSQEVKAALIAVSRRDDGALYAI